MSEPDQNAVLQERFQGLPKVVQDAITSADVQKHLRELADTHKLHLDQWQALENEVMLTLLGFDEPETLQENLVAHVHVSEEVAAALATDISSIVFQPIRTELERQLAQPEPSSAQEEPSPAMLSTTTQVMPGTPPAIPSEEKSARGGALASYHSGQASAERKDVHDDPYRESPL